MCTVVVYIGSLAVYFMDFMRCSCRLGPRNRWTTHLFQMLHNVLYILICTMCLCQQKRDETRTTRDKQQPPHPQHFSYMWAVWIFC